MKGANSKLDDVRQQRITDLFQKVDKNQIDIEDACTSVTERNIATGFSGPVVHKNKRKLITKESLVLPETMPSMKTNYGEFIKYQKIKWKIQRAARKARNESGEAETFVSVPTVLKPGQTLTDFYQKQSRSMMNSRWEIIQIAETDIPGEFRMWILADKTLASIQLTVPRIFYVNCREPDEKGLFLRASKILPRSHVAHHLYKFELSETEYEEQGKW